MKNKLNAAPKGPSKNPETNPSKGPQRKGQGSHLAGQGKLPKKDLRIRKR